MRRAGLALLAAVIATAGVVGTAASEDDDRAAALADEADARARAGDYVGAAALFRQAHAIEPRPEYQCNVGIAYYKAKELPRAQLYLGVCLTRGSHLPEAFVAQVRAALAAVEDRLRKGDFTPVDVVVAPASAEVSVSSFAAGETFVGARTLWLPFGAHTLEARAEGYVTGTVELTLDSRAAVTAALTLEPAPVVDEAAPPDAGVAEPGADAAPVPVPDAGVGAAVSPLAWLPLLPPPTSARRDIMSAACCSSSSVRELLRGMGGLTRSASSKRLRLQPANCCSGGAAPTSSERRTTAGPPAAATAPLSDRLTLQGIKAA